MFDVLIRDGWVLDAYSFRRLVTHLNLAVVTVLVRRLLARVRRPRVAVDETHGVLSQS
jgi:hypothetical protein